MSYITRDDGERFVIPSYRDVLDAKKSALFRKEVLSLSSSYGDYIALQRKNTDQYEVAFSSDPGYLLGETVWHYLKRPLDLIYCEAIPDSTEAILVIVKSGSVYLDGNFSLDTIPDELVIFQTQQNDFEIVIYGDVPISQFPEDGTFSFSESSVKSFTILPEPIFPTLPIVKAFQLQLVDTVLNATGIGVFPLKKVVLGLVAVGCVWMAWSYLSTHKPEIPQVLIRAANPYQNYISYLSSPDPVEEVNWLSNNMRLLATIPGWYVDSITFSDNLLTASVKSLGARTNLLFEWAAKNNAQITATQAGFNILIKAEFKLRDMPTTIYRLNAVVANITDSMSYIIPGNNLTIGTLIHRGKFSERTIEIKFDNISAATLNLVGRQLRNLPLILVKSSITLSNGFLTGTITLRALGN